MRDLKFIVLLLAACLLLLTVSYYIVHPVKANTDSTVVIPSATIAPSGHNSSIEVHQGTPDQPEVIYWNETVDLTLVEGWYGIVERYPGGELVDVSQFSHRIFIDPIIFPKGTYYQWAPEGIFSNANTIAFEVKSGSRPTSYSYVQNMTSGEIIRAPDMSVENLPLPSKHVADYLVAHGDFLNVTFNSTPYNTTAQVWIFENKESGFEWLHPRIGNMSVNFSAKEIQGLEPGKYTILIQRIGRNMIADVTYANSTRTRTNDTWNDVIYSPLGGKNTTIDSWQAFMVKNEVLTRLDSGMWINQADLPAQNIFDDTYELRSLVIEDQYSEITLVDEYYRDDNMNNASIVKVAGYTNVANGTVLSIVLDNDKQNAQTISFILQKTEVMGREIGNRRQFVILYPVYYSELQGAGKSHTFSVMNPDGTNNTASFHVYDAPEGQVKPLQTIRYIGVDEFTTGATPTPLPEVTPPTPTPQIVRVTVTVPVIRTVEITPWYFTPRWLVVWIIIAGIAYYLYWRFIKK